MIRGAQKQMIVVRTRDSRMFEEAYFVMRRGAGRQDEDHMDMLFEANRILENSLPHTPNVGRDYPTASPCTKISHGISRRTPLFWFSLGSGVGGGVVALLWGLIGLFVQ